jgi:two-component system OmpR family response regulator
MTNENKTKIFLVDDDALFLKALEVQFTQQPGFIVETYPTGELCIENLSHNPDLVVLDFMLNGVHANALNGLQTLDKIKDFNYEIPVVMLSAQDKIDVAIECMHHKAFDYVVKSETTFMRLQKIINDIFAYKKMEEELDLYRKKV